MTAVRPAPVALLASLAALGLFAISLYLPSLPALSVALGARPQAAQLTMTLYLVGFAVGQLAYGPISDRIGRRPAMLAGVAIFVLASVAAALAISIEMLIIARFLQAVGASAGPVLSRAIVRDTTSGAEIVRILAVVSGVLALAPTIGLAVGGLSQEVLGWRGCFALLAVLGMAAGLWAARSLPETVGPPLDVPSRIHHDYWLLITDRAVLGYVLGGAAMASGAYLWHSGSPLLFVERMGLSPGVFGLLGLLTGTGYFSGTMLARRSAKLNQSARLAFAGAGLAVIGGLAFLALTLVDRLEIAPIIATMVLYATGVGLVMPTTAAGTLAQHPRIAGTASAAIGFAQMSVGALATWLLGLLDPRSPPVLAALMSAAAILSVASYALTRARGGTSPVRR